MQPFSSSCEERTEILVARAWSQAESEQLLTPGKAVAQNAFVNAAGRLLGREVAAAADE